MKYCLMLKVLPSAPIKDTIWTCDRYFDLLISRDTLSPSHYHHRIPLRNVSKSPNPSSGLHPRWTWGRCSHANTLCHGRPLGDPGCGGGQVQFRCAAQCGSQVVLLLLPPPPAWSFTPVQTQRIARSCNFLFIFLHLRMCVCLQWQLDIFGNTLDTNGEFGEANTRACGGVEFSGCSRSLCRAAGCAYLLLWSAEHKEPNMN